MDDVINFPGYYVVIYTSWKYIHTIYDNPIKIEVTLYNPETRRSITGWDPAKNRVILGIFSYEVISNKITSIQKEDTDLYFEDSNIIKNGLFDERSFKFWTAINSTLRVQPSSGVLDTPYLQVTPIANDYQGIAQTLSTKLGYNYEVSFYVRSDDLLPFRALVRDGSSIYDMNTPEIANYNVVTSRNWTKYNFKFQAISNYSTIFFLKTNDLLDSFFDIDSIYCLEYLESQKQTDINKIKVIDGGQLPEKQQIEPPEDPSLNKDINITETVLTVIPKKRVYDLKSIGK